jgi:hypothetical protein
MVSQIPDKLLLNGQELLIVAVNGSGLFNPAEYDLLPSHACAACWRGCLCHYAIGDGRLVLDDVALSLMELEGMGDAERGVAGPVIHGVRPIFDPQAWPPLNNRYEWLNLDVPFSGGLLAGAGLVGERYIPFGFQPAWQYETVMELFFVEGVLRQTRDISLSVAALRSAMAVSPLLPNARAGEDSLRAWIASAAGLRYNL